MACVIVPQYVIFQVSRFVTINEYFFPLCHSFVSLKKDFEKLTKALQEEHNQLAEYESEVGLMRRRVGFLDEENARLKKKTTEQADEITKLRAVRI